MTALVVDRLHVFVSSTIKECAAERAVVRDAIRSLNHDAVLFEEIGARPHPPRDLYRARLDASQVFIGIYRWSYGWVAPDTAVSGVEDEYRLATHRGMDRLLYVFQPSDGRDPLLQALIDEMKTAGTTLATYDDPEQLRDRVRNDLTALVAGRFVDQALLFRATPTPRALLESLVPDPSHLFRRRQVEADLLDRLTRVNRIIVTAPLGSGKTILLAQLSADNDWVYVDAQGLGRVDVLARVVNALRQRGGQHAKFLTSEADGLEELKRAWDAQLNTVVAVDSASEPEALLGIPTRGRRLVIASRSPLDVPSAERFPLPPLGSEEVGQWIGTLRGARPEPVLLARLMTQSAGNPLYLRFLALDTSGLDDLSLRDLEARAIQMLPPRSREIVAYLALSVRPLSLADLNALVGTADGPEGVAQHLSVAGGLLRQIGWQITLVHEHLRTTALDLLHQTPARLSFFAARLGQFFEDSGRDLAAFNLYLEAGEHRHADRVVADAAHQAAMMGGGAPALAVFRRSAEISEESGDVDGQLQSLLSLAQALKQTGATDEARQVLSDASSVASASGPAAVLRVTEVQAILGLDNRPRAERISDLLKVQETYRKQGDEFSTARIGTLLTAEYIARGSYREAEGVARSALKAFEDAGDPYGTRVARLNLAAALSGISGREQEASQIARDLQQQLDPDEFPRERAVLCNYLTRRFRELGDTVKAAEFANEAIRIGEQLGDQHVISINRTTLGNIRRDDGLLEQALEHYQLAAQVAAEASLRDTEAAASELIASVHNEGERFAAALVYAQHAVGLAGVVGDDILIARAEEERAIALAGQRDVAGAVAAYSRAACAAGRIRPGGSFFVSLVGDGLSLCSQPNQEQLKIRMLADVFGGFQPVQLAAATSPLEALYRTIPLMPMAIPRVERLVPIVALSVADLLQTLPRPIERRVVLQSVRALVDARRPNDPAILGAVAAVLMSQGGDVLSLADMVEVADRLTGSAECLYFKPQHDGAGQWTVRLEIADGIVVSIVQLDSQPRSANTAAILALLLASLDGTIRRELLDAEHLPRREATVNVASRAELEKELGPDLLELGDLSRGFAIAASTDVSRNDQPPMLVICADDFPKRWRPDDHALSDAHLLFGELLRFLAAHLLAEAVEPEVLAPKIGRLIRGIGYRGTSRQPFLRR